jgi:phage tail sheath protein FI
MAQRTINSPGVEIRESDLSFTTPAAAGTSVYVTGFAQQGPIDEVLLISTKQELVQIYGPPTNAAEKYFHYTIAELLNSPATIYTGRLPYGRGAGDGFGSKYSALAYPASAISVGNNGGALNNTTLTNSGSGVYIFDSPVHFELTESQYLSILDGSGYTWGNTSSNAADINNVGNIGKAGIIVLNKTQLANTDGLEGTYVGLLDNTQNPATPFNAISAAKALVEAGASGRTQSFTDIPNATLTFDLTSSNTDGSGQSISRVMENLTDYSLDERSFDDYLQFGVFKLRKSIYANEATKLDYVLTDIVAGSINAHRTQLNPRGGADVSAFIENASDDSQNVKVLVNDNISQRVTGDTGLDSLGRAKLKVRTSGGLRNATSANTGFSAYPITNNDDVKLAIDRGNSTANLFPLGQFTNQKVTDKILGDIPTKIERSLDNIKNDEVYNIDIVVEGGLGTIHAVASAQTTNPYYYDDEDYSSNVSTAVDGLRTSGDISEATSITLRNNYTTIFNKFEKFVKPPYEGGDRGDCIFVADPIRQIVIKGRNTKPLADKTKNFQTEIYWPIRHQFENENTSYATTYGNWIAVADSYAGKQCWVPSSGFGAAAMARTDAVAFPWFAPAGFTRGLVSFANDIAINPNQKQRDELYKANINPIAQFPGSGIVIFGQKTLQKKPSAFDRINVRRLFLSLERPTKQLARQFVFEQNSEFTRTRLVNALTPLFERAKNNEGLFDYLIVCDERNNTPAVVDANELVVDIYLKPTRTAEFILVNFYATRTDANFQELVGG